MGATIKGRIGSIAAAASGGGNPFGAHTYWRIHITAGNNGNTNTELTEVEFRATVGGADQANGGTASGSNELFPASNAFDNNNSTHWECNSGSTFPIWLKYQFTSPVSVGEVSIRTQSVSGLRSPKDFDIQYSDDNSSWTTAWSEVNQTGWGAPEQRLFTP